MTESERVISGSAQPASVGAVTQQLMTLARLYQQGQASEVMDRTLSKLLSYESTVCRAQLDRLRADLAEFEQKYGLSSAEFYRRFQSGQTDDRMDYVEWASLVQMADNFSFHR
ncbi:MAG TPA: hypothetical protein ENJ31_02160 [Anaerolineae bacterium]|nr:hypothetical protein [Anaerolineae bacterium]